MSDRLKHKARRTKMSDRSRAATAREQSEQRRQKRRALAASRKAAKPSEGPPPYDAATVTGMYDHDDVN